MAKKILIVEDEKFLADMYQMKFEKEGYEVLVAYDGREGLNMATKELPDLVLLDIVMPKLDGYQVLEKLRENKKTKKLKIYILSNLGQMEEINKGLNQGADGYLIKANLTPTQLMEHIDNVLSPGKNGLKNGPGVITKKKNNQTPTENNGPKILVIEDEKSIFEMYKMRLEKDGYRVDGAENGAWGLKLAKENSYAAIVMDIMMPAMDGHEMMKKIKKNSKNKKTPIIVLSNSGQEQDIDKAKNCGASCYLLKASITPAKLAKEIKKLFNETI